MMLLELQRRMLGDLLEPLEGKQPPEARAGEYMTDSARLEAGERLAIYRRSYWARVRDAVAEDYPALRRVVGGPRFGELLDAYLQAHPSRSWTLRNLSRALPEWLAAHAQFAGRNWRAAVDVARLEWAYIESFDAASLAPLDAEAVARLGPESRLRLQPHLRLLALESSHIEERVLAAHREDLSAGPKPGAGAGQGRIGRGEIRRGRRYLAVHRVAGVVYYRSLDAGMFGVLRALQGGEMEEGGTLVEGVERFLQSNRQQGGVEARMESLRETLALAAQLGWLCMGESLS